MVINGLDVTHGIPAETKRRVLDAVAKLGYLANPAARSLKGKHNRLLGVHTFESMFPIDQLDFYHEFLVGIEEQAVADGYDLVLFTSTEDPHGRRQIYRNGVNRLNIADGSVLLGVEHGASDLARLAAEGYPFVHVGRREVPGHDIAYAGCDYGTGTSEVVLRLAELGHRRVMYLADINRMEALRDREAGYRKGCLAMGLPPAPAFLEVSDVTPEWLDLAVGTGVTAVMAEHERFAARLADVSAQRGHRIPDDLSVVVLRDATGGPTPDRPWSALGIPRNQMGRTAVRLLVAMLGEPDAPHEHQVLLPCTAPEGSTMAPPA